MQSTCSLLLRLVTAPLALAILGRGDHEAGSGGHHQPIATCPVPMRTSTILEVKLVVLAESSAVLASMMACHRK